MNRGILFFVFGLGAAAPSVCSGDTVAVFDVRLDRTTPPDVKTVKSDTGEKTKSQVTLRLGSDYFEYKDSDHAELINFGTRVVTDRLMKEGQYEESPLLSRIGFISAEFNNRLMQAGLFAKLGMKDNPMDQVLVEHLFSLRAPNSVPLKVRKDGKSESWQHDGKPLFSCATEGTKLTTDEIQMFLRYLRYRFGVHPDILAACAARGVIPQQMEIYRYNMQVEHYSLGLLDFRRTTDASDRTRFLANATRKEEGTGLLCAKAETMSADAFQAACVRLKNEGMLLRDAGNIFDAILLLLEYGLCSDQLQPADLSSIKDAMQGNILCQALFSSIAPTSKENAEQCVKTLQSLEAKTEKGKRVLKIFRANILGNLGHAEEAKALFIEVLTENPANVGAWKDLGDIFYNEYEMSAAWRCWGVARHLLPTHTNFRPVLELEKKLIESYPEFL